MSTIPPNWLGSIIQSHGAQQRADKARAAEAAAAEKRTGEARPAADRMNTIENDDEDSSVYSEGEGAGSQGRSGSDEEPAEEALDSDLDEPEEPTGLDIQA